MIAPKREREQNKQKDPRERVFLFALPAAWRATA